MNIVMICDDLPLSTWMGLANTSGWQTSLSSHLANTT